MAAKLRTSLHEPRLEMTPLLDVVFLLLTFFAFSMLVMVRADVVDVDLPVIDPTDTRAFGLDPAQCSSIILTTVTDVVGFFAFLGFAVVFQNQLM